MGLAAGAEADLGMALQQRTKRVVVGIDGSQASAAAARWAAQEAVRREVELRALQVRTPVPHSAALAAYGMCAGSDSEYAAQLLDDALREVRSVAPKLSVSSEVVVSSNLISGLLSVGCRSEMLVLGCHAILTRSIARSWSRLSAIATYAPIPVTLVEPTAVGTELPLAGRGPVLVLADQTCGIDRLIDYGCAQAERRRVPVDVITASRPRRRQRERALIAAEQELFDTLARSRDRWPGLPIAGHVNVARRDPDFQSRLVRAEMVVVSRPIPWSVLRRCHLEAPLGMRAGPRALTVLPQ